MRTAVALRVMYGQGVRTLQAASLLTKRSLLDRRKARIGEVAKSRRSIAPELLHRSEPPSSAQRNMLGFRRLIIQRAVTRLTRSGGSRPELRLLDAAAQEGIVYVVRIGLDSRKSVRSFKGIICDDISEF